jgi:hypothetical protein
VERCRALLEQRFTGLVQRSGVSYDEYARSTRLLLEAITASLEQDG